MDLAVHESNGTFAGAIVGGVRGSGHCAQRDGDEERKGRRAGPEIPKLFHHVSPPVWFRSLAERAR